MSDQPSLYRRMLGDHFAQLPPALAAFHDQTAVLHAEGVFDVRRGRGWLRRLVAALAGLPRDATAVPLKLRVEPIKDGERWIRQFGDSVLCSDQCSPRPHVMVERFGAFKIRSRATVENGRLLFVYERTRFLGIPLPRWAGPRFNCFAEGDDKRWIVDVRIEAPLLGMITHYHGEVRPC